MKLVFLCLSVVQALAWLNPVPRESASFKRSYLRRRGQRTKAQKRALRELWPQYGIDLTTNRSIAKHFCKPEAPLILDVGFGAGESLIALGTEFTDFNIIGCEVYSPGIGAALLRLAETQLTNVKVVRADVFALFSSQDYILPSLSACFVGFPDPFPTSASRRLLRPEFIQCLAPRLSHSRYLANQNCNFLLPPLSIATDHERYAQHASDLLTEAGWSQLQASCNDPLLRPSWRPVSNYERKARQAQRPIWDLAFAPPPS